MRFTLNLSVQNVAATQLLTLNYQYPLSAAIYKIIQKGDIEYAAFLHDKGYGKGLKKFKLFTFSDLQTPFNIFGDRMKLLTGKASLTVCLHMPAAAENFIKGLFQDQLLEIADKRSRVGFHVEHIESKAYVQLAQSEVAPISVLVKPISPLIIGRKNERGNYTFLSPEEDGYTTCLINNWLEKYKAINDLSDIMLQDLREKLKVELQWLTWPPQKRLITIKKDTPAETKIRGYTKFHLKLTAPSDLLDLAFNAGLGLYNSQGMGCIEIV